MWWWIALAIVGVIVIILYLSSTAGRLDRLHHRVEAGLDALDAQLQRRAAAALELAGSGLLDPASSVVLADAAAGSIEGAGPLDRAQAESDLSAALAAVFDSTEQVAAVLAEPAGNAMIAELSGACHKVEMSRRFHNDAVRACGQLRAHRLVRAFRLAGHAPFPRSAEFDASVPRGFDGL